MTIGIIEKHESLFVARFSPIVRDKMLSQNLYVDTLGLPFKSEGDYPHIACVAESNRIN